jgi:hypothetical protein
MAFISWQILFKFSATFAGKVQNNLTAVIISIAEQQAAKVHMIFVEPLPKIDAVPASAPVPTLMFNIGGFSKNVTNQYCGAGAVF